MFQMGYVDADTHHVPDAVLNQHAMCIDPACRPVGAYQTVLRRIFRGTVHDCSNCLGYTRPILGVDPRDGVCHMDRHSVRSVAKLAVTFWRPCDLIGAKIPI